MPKKGQRGYAEMVRRNRANRKRGSKFEKQIADILGFEVVPYSGSSDRFGWGDVRSTKWTIECKSIGMDEKQRLCICLDWIEKNKIRANGKLHALAFTPRSYASKYILLTKDITKLYNPNNYSRIEVDDNADKRSRHMYISKKNMDVCRKYSIISVIHRGIEYTMMTLQAFDEYMDLYGIRGKVLSYT